MSDARAIGDRFVAHLGEQDFGALAACFQPYVRFRALVPPGMREASDAAGTAAHLSEWFADAKDFELVSSEVQSVADRLRISYRFRGRKGEGAFLIEQQAYCDVKDGLISAIDLLCSGFRPVEAAQGRVHRYDAGDLGCTDGLAQEFRQRIGSMPVGDAIEVVARDPAAKADLPSLARLMGHKVRSVESAGKSTLIITVERAR